MRTYNLGFMRELTDRRGETVFAGYGIESIVDFVDNVSALQDGASLPDLSGRYAGGEDGLAATRIACGAEESLRTGQVALV
jgi:hypothetical protein